MSYHTHTVNGLVGCGKRTLNDPCDHCGKSVWYYCWNRECKKFFRYNKVPHCFICHGWGICPDCGECGCSPNRPKSNEEKIGGGYRGSGLFTITDKELVSVIGNEIVSAYNEVEMVLKEKGVSSLKELNAPRNFLMSVFDGVVARKCVTAKQLEATGRYSSKLKMLYAKFWNDYHYVSEGVICRNCENYEKRTGERVGRCLCGSGSLKDFTYWKDEACEYFLQRILKRSYM